MSPYQYFVYGLRISTSQPVNGLPRRPFDGPPDVRLEIRGPGAWTFAPIPDDLPLDGVKRMGEQWHSLKVWQAGETVHVRYMLNGEQVDFAISAAGNRVRVIWSKDFPADDVPAFFLGPVIGCVLRLRGVVALHAGVVAIGDVAIAVLGDKGAGKSTLVGALAQQGFPVLSDDVAPLFERGEQFWVHPGYPRLRLWPATAEWLGIFSLNLPRVESIFEKRYFDLTVDPSANEWRFCEKSCPLAAAYMLDTPQDGIPVELSQESAVSGLNTLLRNTYADYVLGQSERLQQFMLLVQLASQIPIRRIHRPDNLQQLPQICAAIVDDVRSL